jgi:hypothetical protein
MTDKFYKEVFANSGQTQDIPDATAPNEVSYEEGWPANYSADQNIDPNAEDLDRQKHNGLFNGITSALRQFQTTGTYIWIDATLNDELDPYAYKINDICSFDDGGGVYNLYQSKTDANNNPPTDAVNWQKLSLSTPTPRPNLIIGGKADTNPWQRQVVFSTPFAVSNTSYTADRMRIARGTDSTVDVTVRKSPTPIIGLSQGLTNNSFEIEITTAQVAQPGGSEGLFFEYVMEGYDFTQIAGQPSTATFEVESSVPGVYSAALTNSGNDQSIVFEFTLVEDTPKLISVQVPASPPAGTWDYTNGRGLALILTLMPDPPTQTNTFGAWTATNNINSVNQVNFAANIGNIFRVDKIKIEPGNVFTGYVEPIESTLLAQCERYYEKAYQAGGYPGDITPAGDRRGTAYNNNLFATQESFSTRKRATPAIGVWDTQGNPGQFFKSGLQAILIATTASEKIVGFNANDGNLVPNDLLVGFWDADAEL